MLPFGEGGPEERALAVSAFLARLNGVLRAALPDAWVKGEVGEWRVWSSGHAYFTLKDEAAALPAMMWADDVRRLPFRVDVGMQVLARGRPNVYAPSGKLSFIVSELQPAGLGALQLALRQLQEKLAKEGLFDAAKKRPLPLLPRRIGVVTSRHGAAVRDILKVLNARFPNAHVTIYPVAVQGSAAPAEIERAVRAFSRVRAADVLIVARGGGSKEDLAAFNDEGVVRAIAASAIPTVSAVGHEIDVTLADLAADVRAATPSQAAELVVERREAFEGLLATRKKELVSLLRGRLNEAKAELLGLESRRGLGGYPDRVQKAREGVEAASRALLSSVRNLPAVYGERLAAADASLRSWPARVALPRLAERVAERARAVEERMAGRLLHAGERLAAVAAHLTALDPLHILARGYSVTFKAGETAPLTDTSRVAPGDGLRILLARGELTARVSAVAADGGPRREGDG